ncbi:protein of unknown function [Pseudomonas sp. JV551A1]|uniref:Uncharacterized protein n=1 Tax=Pseudomonas inefficax TaxID=2078786 RepID=A0AAQ1PAA7_9PSED|nr:protein of unknown function [Pseudomonas sp. JV551A1]SPO61591.1 protein of unknown function [Pseudomonas inefficax]
MGVSVGHDAGASAGAMFLAANVADLAQAQAVLVGEQAAGQAVGAFLLDLQVAQLAHEMVSLGDFQGDTGKALDQRVERFGRQHVGKLGALAVLGNVLGPAAIGAGQLVGVVDADAVDQGLQRVGQLADIDAAQVWQLHMALLRDGWAVLHDHQRRYVEGVTGFSVTAEACR